MAILGRHICPQGNLWQAICLAGFAVQARQGKNGYMKIGQIIKALRLERGLSQEALALNVDTATSNLSRIEKGLRTPSIDLLERIAPALGTRVSTIYALAEAGAGEPSSVPSAGWEGEEDIAFRRQYLTLNSENRRMALELLRAMNKVQVS